MDEQREMERRKAGFLIAHILYAHYESEGGQTREEMSVSMCASSLLEPAEEKKYSAFT